ncbi:uncharacterized protein MCYG_04664 [Microsporum canis CBS 113480]|uniref:Uncharacterized protein n=1 Tax=Arthroderma otae (strain ATCC MYA-4605 / CBS 113480) TaxID=554155 RepID=C5FNZ2_ARTOC|nr:uncharacterized protein MCYG_04664 [Microsporum canis CBS 113480]EEQ31845.1 predicted protein [Microsporum canis CBS 113480]
MSGFSSIRLLKRLHHQYLQELIFRLSCTVFSLIAVGFFAGCLRINEDIPVPPSSPVKGRWKDGIPILPLGISILSSIYVAYYIVLRRHSPHLGVQLALDVSVLLGLVPTITLLYHLFFILYTIFVIRVHGWEPVHKNRRRRHRRHGTKERIFVRLDDPETKKDHLASYLQIVNEVSYPSMAATKDNRF